MACQHKSTQKNGIGHLNLIRIVLPSFWRNSPGTLPGLGPMSSPEYFLPPNPIPTWDPPWPGPIFLPRVFPSLCLGYRNQRYTNTEMKFYH